MKGLPTRAEMEAGMKAPPPSIESLEEVVRIREGRVKRAAAKVCDAHRNQIVAMIDVCHAKIDRSRFVAAQGMLL